MKLFWWFGVVVVLGLSRWGVDGFVVEYSLNETELSLLDSYGVSKASNNPLLVGLTLIHGANGNGAGTLLQPLLLFFFILF